MRGAHSWAAGYGESKTFQRYLGQPFDYVITTCHEAREACPWFPGSAQLLHWDFPDPATIQGREEERLAAFRSVRDGLRQRLEHELLNERRV